MDSSFFLIKTTAVHLVEKKGHCTFTVDVQHKHVAVVILYGSAISTALKKAFSYKDGSEQTFKTEKELQVYDKVWVFTFLTPSPASPSEWMLRFGIGAGDDGGTGAQVRLESKLGDANILPTSLGTLPRTDFISSNYRSPTLANLPSGIGNNNVWIALGDGNLSMAELDAHIFLVNDQKNIVGYWGKGEGNQQYYGSNVAGDYYFICLVNASAAMKDEKNKTGFHFHVGDPRKDARVVIDEGGM